MILQIYVILLKLVNYTLNAFKLYRVYDKLNPNCSLENEQSNSRTCGIVIKLFIII